MLPKQKTVTYMTVRVLLLGLKMKTENGISVGTELELYTSLMKK